MKTRLILPLALALSASVLTTACADKTAPVASATAETAAAAEPAAVETAAAEPAATETAAAETAATDPAAAETAADPAAATAEPAGSLQVTDVKVGDGAVANAGQVVSVHYTGWLYDAAAADKHGIKFDSSVDRGEPFQFPLGAGRVIQGWDQGVAGMKIGGQRTLVIPPEMGYGANGAGGLIPPNATLIFDVELLGIE